MSDSTSIINLQDVTVSYGDKDALSNCTLTVTPGESIAFLGPNGAGKTTTLEIIGGFRRPSKGKAQVFGKDPINFDAFDISRVGIVLQNWRDHALWPVKDLIDLVEYSHLQTGRADRDYTKELISVLGIADLLEKKFMKLSGGERRRVDTCLALISKPELLILDEPTTAFDPNLRRKFHQLMAELKDCDTTLLWATHDLLEAEQNCERILLLNHGVIVKDASPAELRAEVEGGVSIEWRDAAGNHHTEKTTNPDNRFRELVLSGARDIRVSATSFEDIYLELLEGMEENVTAA